MFLKALNIENFRNLNAVSIQPHEQLNLVYGDNGAGKTSIIEAILVLSRGRSFRTTSAAELVGPEESRFRVFAETGGGDRLGIERSGNHWRARKNGSDVRQLSRLTTSLPLMMMEPNSHLLVSGSPENRRKYLDWGVFHVEHAFLEVYRRYTKSLKQRNAALRLRQQTVLESLEAVMAETGARLDELRERQFERLESRLGDMLEALTDNIQQVRMRYRRGWVGDSLVETLAESRSRDLERGTTTSGPHRADIELKNGDMAARAVLSRGEQKILAAALLLCQAEIMAERGEQPLLLLDDLASEFDEQHFRSVLERAMNIGGQVWVTGTRLPEYSADHAVFHVEHGRVDKVV